MKRKNLYTVISIIIWIMIWTIASLLINRELFLPTPLSVIKAMGQSLCTKEFYLSILFSLKGIALGFLIGFFAGIISAVCSHANTFCRAFIDVFMKGIKSVPVASFVILALLWIASDKLSILIASLIVMPVIYTNTLSALDNTDIHMLEFARVFRLSTMKKIMYIYIPAIMPSLISACRVSIGYAWKSGVAAEIIGLISGSIGNELYKAKLYLDTPVLFTWTLTIIAVSFICEKAVVFLLSLLQKHLGGITGVNNN